MKSFKNYAENKIISVLNSSILTGKIASDKALENFKKNI